MKLRQKFAAIMAAMILATSLPAFAASTNGMNKIITVAKDTSLDATSAPKLNIELKDELTTGQAFYLSLENAEWDKDIATKLEEDADFKYALSSNEKELEVQAKSATLSAKRYSIPMLTKVTGGEASVIIDSNDTVVTSGKYVFAVSNNTAANVTVADAKSFVNKGQVAEITIEEAHIGAFNKSDDQQVRFELRGSGFEFDLSDAKEVKDADGKVLYTELKDVLVGGKAHGGEKFSAKIIDEATLEVTIEKGSFADSKQRGSLILTGVEVKSTKDASFGDVMVTVSGDLNDTTDVLVAKYGDYGTKLEAAKEYEAVAGTELKDIEFTLSETVANSLIGTRETVFTFPEGVTIKEVSVKEAKDLKEGAAAVKAVPEKKDDKNTNVFTVASIDTENTKKASITFRATLNVPAAFDKDINLVVSGRSLEEEKEIELVKVTAPATVEVTPVTVKVGLARQTGGKIVITETAKDTLKAGKIFLAIDDSDIKYTKAPEVKVTEGNLKIGDVEVVTGGIEITVKSRSTEASTIEISDGELKVDRTVPEGKYAVKVGGTAISAHSAKTLWNTDKKEHNDIDAITETDFIIVGTPNTEDMNNGRKNKASFVIGQANYTVNGEERTMDTAAYLAKEGRTMLPIRYVSDALGVKADQILWDNASKTVTVLADRIVQIKLGNKSMVINGATIPMTAAAEMKNDRIFIPVAEIARALGANVAWDEVARTATFN